MNIETAVAKVGLKVLVAADLAGEVRGGYCSDLLSDVLAHAESGDIWITHQRHLNVVAVGKLRNVAGVVFARGLCPSQDVISRATAERVNLFLSTETAFEVAGRLHRALYP